MTPTKRFFEYIIPGVPILAVWKLVLAPTLSACAWAYLLQRGNIFSTRHGLFLFLLGIRCDQWFNLIMALSLPGALIGSPITIPVQTVLTGYPEIIFARRIWLVWTTPLFCWPAGWLAGRGWDEFFAKTPCRKWMTILGSILCIGCAALGVSGLFAGKDFWDLAGIWFGAIIWTAAFGVFPANWWRHRRQTGNHD